ncbi:MAG TPA: MurT ligase domain-containing protein [Acidimicrobiales bacterium]|nr:MurT ligase domain-containing protein [Acidimicrobiales bacterium]
MTPGRAGGALGPRARLAAWASDAVSASSRRLHLGGGSVIGGRVGLVIAPGLLATLAAGRAVALVTGTNGKTTTTRLLAAALGGPGRVATSQAGANLPAGLVRALSASAPGAPAVLEVDEGYLATVSHSVGPTVVMLLNLSRDQLDRVSEVRMVAGRWRAALADSTATVVANADDPLVVFGAGAAPRVVWVAAGQLWRNDAVGCPACSGRITFDDDDGGWCCRCGFRRPAPHAVLRGEVLERAGGKALAIRLSLPGRCNRANAAMAAMAADVLGVDPAAALAAMAEVRDVEGRFAAVDLGDVRVRLLLAKNPAGWTELLDLLDGSDTPVVIGINARVADGHDPSWLWDVPFERLAGRTVVATGERCRDLAVRLRHAGVAHWTVPDQLEALRAPGTDAVDYVGNYTAFQGVRRRLGRGAGRAATEPVATRPQVPGVPPPPSAVPRALRGFARPSALRVVVVHPDLLGTYGDGGNGQVLAGRAAWRDIDVELVHAPSDAALPSGADVYCLGGGEDGPQVQSAERLRDGALARAVDAGAVVLAVCAGFQVLGTSFPGPDGRPHPGVGLLDVESAKGTGRRAVGELAADPFPLGGDGAAPDEAALEILTGFENHGAVTRLGPGARPLARVVRGVGNGSGGRLEGARVGRVIGTYMHGPALARNPALADLLLAWATGRAMPPLEDAEEDALRAERLAAVGAGGHRMHGGVGDPLVRLRSRVRRRRA